MLTARRAIVLLITAVVAAVVVVAPMLRPAAPRPLAAQLCFGVVVGSSEPDACVPLP